MSHCHTHDEDSTILDASQALGRLQDELDTTYRTIETQVAHLGRELARARDERLQQSAEKERLADRLQSLLSALPAAVLVLDGQGRIQQCNPAASALLGEPLAGEVWRTVIARAVDPNRTDAGHDVVLRSGRLVSLTTCPLGVEPGQIVLLQDVTEDRRLQEKLGQHRRLVDMGRMAASLAHQIRTPLASALLYASHLRNPDLSGPKRGRFAEKVVESLRSLERLINDMLVFSRGGGGEWEVFAPEELVRAAVAATSEQLERHAIQWRIGPCEQGLFVRGNRTLVLTALQNLISNAAESMSPDGQLTLSARAVDNGRAVDIEVADRGAGLPAEMGEQIFEPFVTTRSGGTGLGLAVVRAVARTHGGEVRADAREGGGTCFTLRLPTYAAPAESSSVHRLAQA